jgi:hypothetical protein
MENKGLSIKGIIISLVTATVGFVGGMYLAKKIVK